MFKTSLFTGLIGLTILSQCCAAEIDRTIIKEYENVRVTHEPEQKIHAAFIHVDRETGVAEYRMLPEDHFVREDTFTVFTGPPGEYQILTEAPIFLKIVRESRPDPSPDPRPDPRPDPTPDPEPGPDPVNASTLILLKESTDSSNPSLVTDIDFWRSYKDRGLRFFSFDVDTQEGREWKSVAKGKTLPVLFIWEDKDRYIVEELPETKKGVEKLIQQTVVRSEEESK